MKNRQNISTQTLKTSFGEILAVKDNGVVKAKHIRYAYSERFKKPVAVQHLQKQAIFPERTPVCPQNISPLLEKMIGETNPDHFEMDESPQYLSVFSPENCSENEKLPVIVWIHGGSYEIGCGDIPTADPTDWVKEQRVIVVTVSYRLGIFGFLGSTEQRPPNLGLFDMIEALKWIKTYISDFGGDAENITLFGQSSGGDAIAHLMISEGTENLFQRVIIHSAPLGLRKNRQKMLAEFFRKTENYTAKTKLSEIIDNYSNFSPSFSKYGLKAAMRFGTQYGFSPLPEESDAEDQWKKSAKMIDVLIGINDEETAFYLKASEKLNRFLPKRIMNKAIRVTTETIYGRPAKAFAENLAQAGGNVYLFRLYSRFSDHPFGAAHAIDLPFVFGNRSAWENTGILKNMSWEYIHENGQKLRNLWAGFARTGKVYDETEKPDIIEIKKI